MSQKYADISGKHPFYVSKTGEMGSGYQHILIRKFSYFKESLDSVLGALFAAGIYDHLQDMDHLQNEIIGLKMARNSKRNKVEALKGMTLKYLWIPCGLIFMGYLLACIAFMVEITASCFKGKKAGRAVEPSCIENGQSRAWN